MEGRQDRDIGGLQQSARSFPELSKNAIPEHGFDLLLADTESLGPFLQCAEHRYHHRHSHCGLDSLGLSLEREELQSELATRSGIHWRFLRRFPGSTVENAITIHYSGTQNHDIFEDVIHVHRS